MSSIEPARPVAAVILAAGKSTRMKSKLPKPLHKLCGLALTSHVIRACQAADISKIVVVVGHEADQVKTGLGCEVEYALQREQKGTGDAMKASHAALADWTGTILTLSGDVPLLSRETIVTLLSHHTCSKASATLLTAILPDATGYGRIIRDDDDRLVSIREQKDATETEKLLKEINPACYVFEPEHLWNELAGLKNNNNQGEYYLTDVITSLVAKGERVEAIPAKDHTEVLGINNRIELEQANEILRHRILNDLMLSGVTIVDAKSTYVEVDVTIGQDTVIEPNTIVRRGTTIGEDCEIGPNTLLDASQVGHGCRVLMSRMINSKIGNYTKLGPYANLRDKAIVGDNCRIGNYVEIKNSNIGDEVKASHLAYIGDGDVGDCSNIGAGVIFCNFDGFEKHRTVVGKDAFIGSNVTLIAPATVGDGAIVAAGSHIPGNVPAESLAIARSVPIIKEGWATKYKAKKTANSLD